MEEASWQYYARGMMIPLSPVAKKSRESNSILDGGPEESKEINAGKPGTFAFTSEHDDNNKMDFGDDIGPDANFLGENNFQRQSDRNAMLKRLANCFNHRQKRANLVARRNRVMGFFPKLCTIHENASELVQDLEENYQLAEEQNEFDRDSLEHDSIKTNDQKIAALHQDIKELWKRLENVEKEFAWARGTLKLAQHTKLK